MNRGDTGANTALPRTNMTGDRPLENVASCQDLPVPKPVQVAAPEFRPGQILDGRFFILEAVHCGGMATIYRAEDRDDGRRHVAVKVPLPKFEGAPGFFARFQREEEVGLKLNHPLLLKFVPVGETRTRPYIVTEYLSGCTLDYIIHQRRRLPEADALRIASVVGDALRYMHENGVIHNDLKPANIMICPDRTLRLIDFGLASHPDERRGIFGPLQTMFGTPQYMAPEQVQNRRTDARTDIYTLGAILYEMLTGQLPFPGEDPWAFVRWRISSDPEPPRRLNPAISAQAEEIILHAMQRKPAARYQTVTAFQAELDAPERVHVTGYSLRLKKPRWKFDLEKTQLLFGTMLGVGTIAFLVAVFFGLTHFLGRR